MNFDLDSLTVVHNEPESRFEIAIGDDIALAAYHMRDALMVMHHTEVPQYLEGRGIAAKLVHAALDFARTKGLKVLPTCSYVAAFFRKNPGYRDLLRSEDVSRFLA
jgi:predicted GNAT family acetyltransferase